MHCFSGKGCSEFPKSMHYWVGILRRAANNYNNRKNSEKKPGAQTGHKGTTLSKEKVEEKLTKVTLNEVAHSIFYAPIKMPMENIRFLKDTAAK